jgi:hypothetical protein
MDIVINVWETMHIDETPLPIIYKPKHPKKWEYKGTKWKDPCPRKQKNHLRGWTTRRTSSSQTPSCCEKYIKEEGKGRSQDLLNPDLLQTAGLKCILDSILWDLGTEVWVDALDSILWDLGIEVSEDAFNGHGVQVSFIKAGDFRLNSASRDVPDVFSWSITHTIQPQWIESNDGKRVSF